MPNVRPQTRASRRSRHRYYGWFRLLWQLCHEVSRVRLWFKYGKAPINSRALAESNFYAPEARNLRFVFFAGLRAYHWTEGAGENHIAGPQVLAFVSELSCQPKSSS